AAMTLLRMQQHDMALDWSNSANLFLDPTKFIQRRYRVAGFSIRRSPIRILAACLHQVVDLP
ncbi:MAG: hypothetical protein ACPGQS_06585, partial [Bradymonadia bacterium]